eukprot:PhF_6_TR16518/c0_g1_i2/m.25235
MAFVFHYPQENLDVIPPGSLITVEEAHNAAASHENVVQPPALIIRDATLEDASAIADLMSEFYGVDVEGMRKNVTLVLQDCSKGIFQVADYGDVRCVGCVFVSYEFELSSGTPRWNVHAVCVAELHRNKGIGKALLRVVCEKGSKWSASSVVVRANSNNATVGKHLVESVAPYHTFEVLPQINWKLEW